MSDLMKTGKWIVFYGVPADIMLDEVQHLFKKRMGIDLLDEQISIKSGRSTVLVSLSDDDIRAIVAWAFQEDMLGGNNVCVRLSVPSKRVQTTY